MVSRAEPATEPAAHHALREASREATAEAPGERARRRWPADPVPELMYRHRELCERAVDSLEIAAGLEAHGVNDRTAAFFRHRDVFSLAEELYARVPRARLPECAVPGTGTPGRRRRAVRRIASLLPGVLCAGTVLGLAAAGDAGVPLRCAIGVTGALAVLVAVGAALGWLSPRTPGAPRAPGPRMPGPRMPGSRTSALWVCWLVAYALLGDWLLAELLAGGPEADGGAPVAAGPYLPLVLACAVAPAVRCADGFARQARYRLTGCRGLGEFAAGVRPLLTGAVLLFAGALLALECVVRLLLGGPGPAVARQVLCFSLGVLLFTALLLAAHGFRRAASAGLAAACAAEVAALASVLAARLPGLGVLGRPVEPAVAAAGTAVVPAAATAAAALGLLAYAARVLTGASAHAPEGRNADLPNRPPAAPFPTPLPTPPERPATPEELHR